MTPLRRSCQACVKARRRCNLATPCCERCSAKRIKCCYVNQPAPATSDKHSTSMIKPIKEPQGLSIDLDQQSLSLLVVRGELDTGLQIYIRQVLRDGPPLARLDISWQDESSVVSRPKDGGLRIFNPLHLEVVRVFDQTSLHRLSSILQSFPGEFAEDNTTSFIHPGIYKTNLPSQLRDVKDICYSFQVGGNYLADHRLHTLRSIIRRLLRSSTQASSFPETLAYAQSIILTQIIRLLSCSDPNSDQIERDNESMWALTHTLWQKAPTQLPSTLSPWQAWLFSESVRRTILVCNILLAVYSSLKRGYTIHSLCIEALPFDLRTQLWDARAEEEWDVASARTKSPALVTLSQFTTFHWGVDGGSRFEDLLVLAFGK